MGSHKYIAAKAHLCSKPKPSIANTIMMICMHSYLLAFWCGQLAAIYLEL